ncbi:MAG: DUF3604 domain-containing protein [Halieaceae bacterium]
MNSHRSALTGPRCIAFLGLLSASIVALAFERTEQREPCDHYTATRQPLFGDLHVHTSYSFDSYVSSQRNDPWAAYRYAKGEAIMLSNADAQQTIRAQLQRPLDFTAITDHAEFLGPVDICTQDAGELGYWFPYCVMSRSETFILQMLALDYWASLGVVSDAAQKEASFVCSMSDCDAAHRASWGRIQKAAEDHYDRSGDCSFTTFVGYEYTDAPDFRNLHRNVIFRNQQVTESAISTYDTGTMNFPELWTRLRRQCIEADGDCDVMSIPHNPNLSGGLMFPDPLTKQQARDRLFFEPLVELVQHKAASECRFDRLAGMGLDTEDELCSFEQVVADNLSMLGTVFGEVQADEAAPVAIDQFGRRNMVRNVLKDGLKLGRETGTNPFKMGFIGSTDTHSATPGGAEENNYVGHLGRRDAGYRNLQDHFFDNPGGLAVVWAEENSRDAIFEGMRRKETYATSGTRPLVRFFAGTDLPTDLCASGQMIEQAYANGVPMGGELEATSVLQPPRFLVSAMKDAGSPGNPGVDLQRVQIVKGWIDQHGNTREAIHNVAGNPDNGASVDPGNCALTGTGHAELCAVWQDPDFDPDEDAFYYARVLENPSCRWSTLQCQAAGVNPFASNCAEQAAARTEARQDEGAWGDVYGRCCLDPVAEPFYSPIIQERAWTSPIWYSGVEGDSRNQ